MKNITKRLLASILAAGTLLTVTPAFAEMGGEITKSVDPIAMEQAKNDELKAEYAEELALLSGLGIISDTNIKLNNNITRGEFLNLVMKMIQMDGLTTENEETVFYDVLPESDYYNAVMSAHKLGLVNGDSYGCFNPNQTINAAAALKILVCALEFRSAGEAKGGYPNGFIAVARDLDIVDSVSVYSDIIWKDAISLIDNALHSYAAVKSYDQNGVVTAETGDQTVLEKYYDVVRYKGIVEETNLTLRMQGKGEDKAAFVINGKLYTGVGVSSAESDSFLGKAVIYYIKEETNEIICVSEDTKYNTTTVIAPEDIQSANTSLVKYWDENDKEKKINISDNADFYYNGVLTDVDELTADDLKPENGELTLIDNDRDNTADVVIIESWEDMVLARTSTEILVSMYNDGKTINLKETDMVFYKDGFEINEFYLGAWDVLKIMRSKDGKAGYANVFGYSEVGKVEKLTKTKNNEPAVVLDGVEYKLAKTFVDAYTRGDRAAITPKKGETYTFIVDDDNAIYGIENVATSNFEYGYLIAAAAEGGLSATYKAKIYGKMGSMKVYDVAENIKVNGKKCSENFLAEVSNRYGVFEPQPVMYMENSKGELAELKLAVDMRYTEPKYDIDNFSLDRSAEPVETENSSTGAITITGWSITDWANQILGQQVSNDGKTPMFYIPYDLSDDDSYGYVDAYENYSKWSNKYTDIEIYDLIPYADDGKYNRISAIYLYERPRTTGSMYTYSSLSQSGFDSYYYVVDEVYETLDQNGDVVTAAEVTGTGKEELIVYFKEDAQNVDTTGFLDTGGLRPDDLQSGDVVVLSYDNVNLPNPRIDRYSVEGHADKYRIEGYEKILYNTKMYDGNWDSFYAGETTDGTGTLRMYGEIYYIDNEFLILRSTDENGKDVFFGAYKGNTTMWDYSVGEKKARLTNISALGAGDRIFTIFKWGSTGTPSVIMRIVE